MPEQHPRRTLRPVPRVVRSPDADDEETHLLAVSFLGADRLPSLATERDDEIASAVRKLTPTLPHEGGLPSLTGGAGDEPTTFMRPEITARFVPSLELLSAATRAVSEVARWRLWWARRWRSLGAAWSRLRRSRADYR